MICPKCGNTITMQEYKCGICGLDLNCSTPEGRMKAEEYANQKYASGEWKVRNPVQKITDIPEKRPQVVYEKPKRNPFKIATVILGISTAMFAILFMLTAIAYSETEKERIVAINERDAAERLQESAIDFAVETSVQNANSVSEASSLVEAYKREAEADYRAVNEIISIYGSLTGSDFSEVISTIETTYHGYVDGLDKIDSYGTSDSAVIERIEKIRSSWKTAIDKTYAVSENLRQ